MSDESVVCTDPRCGYPNIRDHDGEGYHLEEDHGPYPHAEVKECRWFAWIGQNFAHCENCGRDLRDHDGLEWLPKGAPLFGDHEFIPFPDAMERIPLFALYATPVGGGRPYRWERTTVNAEEMHNPEVSSLRRQVQQLTHELVTDREALMRRDRENEELRQRLAHYRDLTDALNADVERLKDDFGQARINYDDLIDAMKRLQAKRDWLVDQLSSDWLEAYYAMFPEER